MKGLMLFFIAFGLFAALGDNDDAMPQVTEVQPVIEEVQPVEEKKEEQVVEMPAVTDLTDPIIDPEAVYTAEVELIGDINTAREIPLYVKDGFVYYYTQEWNGMAYDLSLTKAAVSSPTAESGEKSDEVLLFRNNPSSISTYYVYPMNGGGYIGIGNEWGTDANYSEYLLKYDASGKMTDKKSIAEITDLDFSSVYFDKVVSDGSNMYVRYEGYSDSKAFGGIMMFDVNFELVENFTDSEWAQHCVGNDGLLYVVDGYTGDFWSYNPKTGTKSTILQDNSYSYYVYPGQGNEILFGYDTLYSYNSRTSEVTKLFDFEELGLSVELCDLIYRDAEGNIVVLYANYTEPDTGIFRAVIKSSGF